MNHFKGWAIFAALLLVAFVSAPSVHAATFDLAESQTTKVDTQELDITHSPWTLNKKSKNEVTFTLTNESSEKVSGLYTIVITPLSPTDSKAIYEKTTKIKNLKAGASKKVKLALNKAPIFKKLKEGHYNIELFVNGQYAGSVVLAVSKESSQTATVRVWTSHDGLQLAKGATLTIYAEVDGTLPKGGHVDLAIVTKEKTGTISTWYPSSAPVIAKGTSGKKIVFITVPYDYSAYGPYISGDEHYAFARLFPGTTQGLAVHISEASAPSWFFTR